jgi:hypothetical protein
VPSLSLVVEVVHQVWTKQAGEVPVVVPVD